jgi:hypothetical protein
MFFGFFGLAFYWLFGLTFSGLLVAWDPVVVWLDLRDFGRYAWAGCSLSQGKYRLRSGVPTSF